MLERKQMKLIDASELAILLADSECLRRLKSGGVDNWDWYYESLNNPSPYEDWLNEDLDVLMDKYKNYNPKEIDNYNFD